MCRTHEINQMVFDIIEGDRKAYYESAEWKMKENREKISKLRSENKELRKVKCDKLAVSDMSDSLVPY